MNNNETTNHSRTSRSKGAPQKKKAKASKKTKRPLLKILFSLFLLGCIGLFSGLALFISYAKDSPELTEKALSDVQSSNVYGLNGELIYTMGQKKREVVASSAIPEALTQAITSIEDKRFEKHIGVDPIRILGALASNIKGNNLQGGSTLTQQLIKLSFFSTSEADQTLKRKAQEAWMSVQLEREKSKEDIMSYYINKVYMSNGLYGMRTAAQTFYGKELDELSLAQTALFAGLPQSPNEYDPYEHPENAKTRRDMVLKQMYQDKHISQSEYDKAVAEPIDEGLLAKKDTSKEYRVVDNYIKEVIEEVKQKTDRDIYTEGLDIYTNIDLDAQKYLYNLVNTDEYVAFPNKDLQVGITVMEADTGKVVSQIGARNVSDDTQLGTNRATDNARDFASTMKPINVYAPAIEYLNYSTGRLVVDEPYKYVGTDIDVNNYDNMYKGTMTIREALVDSRNVPAVKTLNEVGLENVAEFQKKINLYNEDIGVVQSSAIHQETNSLVMAGAYAPLANGGKYYQPSYVNKIVFNDGTETVYEDKGTKVMKDSTAYMVTDMLKDVISRGTGMNTQIAGVYQAGKTGTSNYDEKDAAKIKGEGVPNINFVGYTKNYVISIWTGYDDFWRAIPTSEQGIAMALYRNMMAYMMQSIESTDWEKPDSVIQIGNQLYVKGYTTNQNTGWSSSSQTPVTEPSSSEESIIEEPSSSEETEQPGSSSTPESQEPPESSSTPESQEPPESSSTPESQEPPESSSTPESQEPPESNE